MALPTGFNPNNMSFGNITKATPVIEIPRNTYTYTPTRSGSGPSLWSRFNNGVADIGNWFAEKCDIVLGWVSLITIVGIVIAGIVKIISTWSSHGFFTALLTSIVIVIVGVIAFYIAAIAIVIGVNVVMYGLRFLFWNGWTLLIALTLGTGVWIYASNASRFNRTAQEPRTEIVMPVTQTYQCTAKVLNVRTAPDTSGGVLGVLRKGDTIEVYETENGFARISFNGNDGYVSLKYLNRIN